MRHPPELLGPAAYFPRRAASINAKLARRIALQDNGKLLLEHLAQPLVGLQGVMRLLSAAILRSLDHEPLLSFEWLGELRDCEGTAYMSLPYRAVRQVSAA